MILDVQTMARKIGDRLAQLTEKAIQEKKEEQDHVVTMAGIDINNHLKDFTFQLAMRSEAKKGNTSICVPIEQVLPYCDDTQLRTVYQYRFKIRSEVRKSHNLDLSFELRDDDWPKFDMTVRWPSFSNK